MEIDPAKLVPLARLRRDLGAQNYQASLGGEGLYSLSLPAKLWLYSYSIEEKERGNTLQAVLRLAARGIDPDTKGELQPVRLLKIRRSGRKYVRLELEALSAQNEANSPLEQAAVPTDAKSLWLCALPEQLKSNAEEPYFFQIRGLEVTSKGRTVARVKDYFETKAHGILVLTLSIKEEQISDKTADKTLEGVPRKDPRGTSQKTLNKQKMPHELMLPCVEEHVQWDENLGHIEVPHFESFLEAEGIQLS